VLNQPNQQTRLGWVSPALFFGNNPIRLAGGAIASASSATMIGCWLAQIFDQPNAIPYLGIISCHN
jgi:hypothetical protein